jgi:hypothetical protein
MVKEDKIKTIITAVLFILLCACCPTKSVTTSNTTNRDSVVIIKERLVRDTISLPKEVYVNVVPPDSSSYLQTTYAESYSSLRAGKLYHSLTNKPVAPIVYHTRDTIYNTITKTEYKEAKTIIDYKTPWYNYTICGLLIAIIIFLLIKVLINKVKLF